MALVTLGGGLLYLESFRSRLLETRAVELVRQGEIIAGILPRLGPATAREVVAGLATPRGTRVRLYAPDGARVVDNWSNPATTRFQLIDPARAGFRRRSAIAIDRLVDWVTGQQPLPLFEDPAVDQASAWPEVAAAARTGMPQTAARQTEDRLVVLQAAVPVRLATPGPQPVLLLTTDTPDVVDLVRRERQTSFFIFLAVLALSLALSLYLARIIVVPLRQLARAAHRVRMGRAREVVVPRLPARRDELGMLARALADMTAALRHRIDATEAFAADVAHELKNPLASLRSAVEALPRVADPAARDRLLEIIEDDVRRIDRLISDIAAASRLDAELSRARLHPVDVAALAQSIATSLADSGRLQQGPRIRIDITPGSGTTALADSDRLAQVIHNLLDNAISFSPADGTVGVAVSGGPDWVELSIEDEGPGVPPESRHAVFERFYSERPSGENYGGHSGLGLSIARAIVEAMEGHISVVGRRDGRDGARFVVQLPPA
jgi:two-component system sensor histidine kinase ChvG